MEEILYQEILSRQKRCLDIAAERGLHALLIIGNGPRRAGDLVYLAGHMPMLPGHPRRYIFKGRGISALLLPIDQNPVMAVTTPFYEQDIAVEDVRFDNNLILLLGKIIREAGLERADVGLVGTDILPVALYFDLIRELPHINFIETNDIVMNLRAQKSEYEIDCMRKGAKYADITAQKLKSFLKPGVTEADVGKLIRNTLTELGVDAAFATCQSGERSKEPYDIVPCSNKVIEDGDMVHMEINGKYKGYMIDVCRSTVVGHMCKEQEFLLELTIRMLEDSIAATKPGIRAEELEAISGKLALEHDLGKNHTAAYGGPGTYLGHAAGLGVDEPPCLAKGDKTILKPGMVLTIEPGIYRTQYGGCRIEDEVLVTKTGSEVLNTYGRRLWLD